jgi:hypothetical protein
MATLNCLRLKLKSECLMSRIVLPPLPVDGSDLLTNKSESNVNDAYTKSLYTALGERDVGLMSTLNGKLEYVNLNSDFKVKSYHIQPEQASLARMESMRATSTVYGNGIPSLVEPVTGNEIREISSGNFFTVPGCSLRWYQPYATSVSLMQWSFFLSFNCWRGCYKDMEGTYHSGGVDSPITVRCRLDNNVVPASERHLGHNMFHPISPGAPDRSDQTGPGMYAWEFFKSKTAELEADGTDAGIFTGVSGGTGLNAFDFPEKRDSDSDDETDEYTWAQRGGNPQYAASEAHTATQFDLHHTTALSKGFHEISIECAIGTPDGAGVYLQNLGKRSKTFVTGRGYFNLVGKVSLGIRNARVLNLL